MSDAEADASTDGRGLADAATRLRASPLLGLIVGVAAAVAILAALLLWTRSPDYAVLYSGLADRDGGDVVARLEQMQVPFELAAGGATIKVARADVDRIRLQLAGDGLPKGGGVGFEIMDEQPFGVSEFAEQVNYHRALEGELARSIETIDEVADARLQLAMPKATVFVREREQPKASVIVELYRGRALADGQVAAIQHLVASAVPGLPVDAVTLVDGRGHLLSSESNAPGSANGSRLAYVSQVEKTYRKRIRTLLAPIVGAANVRAQVAADVDFTARERTRENYTPNTQDKPAAVRSRQSRQTLGTRDDNGGVPGALSNQPSPDVASPINDATSKQNAASGEAGRAASQNSDSLRLDDGTGFTKSRNSTTNYELDRVIQHVTDPVGGVQRVSVSVVINQRALATHGASDGGSDDTANDARLPAARIEQIRGLVRGAIGFSAERGDSVAVMQLPFSPETDQPTQPTPVWWQDARLQALALKIFKYLAFALVAWLLWARLVRPLAEHSALLPARRAGRKASAEPAGAAETDADPEENEKRQQRDARRKQHQNLVQTTQQTARDDPRIVAMIVKSWMKSDG